MSDPRTVIGGDRDSFPETAWTTILNNPDPHSPKRIEKLNKLASLYWRPVFGYIRSSWRTNVEDAKDLTQGFFCHILEGDLISRYRSDKGRFRHFLKGAVKNFLAETHRDSLRQKRTGDRKHLSLTMDDVDFEGIHQDKRLLSPEELFDRQWAREVLKQGYARLKELLTAEGKLDHLKIYEAYDLAAPGRVRPTYESLAQSLGLEVHDVRNHLSLVRTRLYALLLESVADYVVSRNEADEEMKDLFSGSPDVAAP